MTINSKIDCFEFTEELGEKFPSNIFVVSVPAGISSKRDLLESIARVANFPEYFGGNWDAFFDCLLSNE